MNTSVRQSGLNPDKPNTARKTVSAVHPFRHFCERVWFFVCLPFLLVAGLFVLFSYKEPPHSYAQ